MVLIRSAGETPSEQRELEIASQFYGLDLRVVTAGESADQILASIRRSETVAVAIEAGALANLDQKAVVRALHRTGGSNVPLLILDIAPETNPALLKAWSGDVLVSVQPLSAAGPMHYLVGSLSGVTDQLTGLEIPSPGDDAFYFAGAASSRIKAVISLHNGTQLAPVFLEAEVNQQRIFLLCKKRSPQLETERNAENTETAFAEVAPEMIFAKYGAGERGWHALHHDANLTIDDPWLREPYGHLDYNKLLTEMESHNFHTTIAFIPWNYDRSEQQVVALFRDHPERFSICVHGDNHDHKEFDDYESKSLSLQIAALRQSLARMDKFQALTGIPYDKVFVFPHNIGSERILEQLKSYNFDATVNSLSVPMDRTRPASSLFTLRPVTLFFGDFPSIARYGAVMPKPASFIAINEFLDNPIFFYGHQELFANGIGAFDRVADDVNRIEPDTRWRSLGEMAGHLYLVRLRDDANYDVLAFSSSLDLGNTSGRNSIFYIQKPESDSAAIASVSVESQPVPFQFYGGALHLSVAIPAGESRKVLIRYKNDLDLASVSISKSSPRVYLLRMISDFRDITLSRYRFGRAVTEYYYKDQMSPMIVIVCVCAIIVLSLCGMYVLVLMMKRKKEIALTHDLCARS
ncbi:MAG: hypothetical protein WA198_06840 [Candidatus Sulfotelmatobacter sp.]